MAITMVLTMSAYAAPTLSGVETMDSFATTNSAVTETAVLNDVPTNSILPFDGTFNGECPTEDSGAIDASYQATVPTIIDDPNDSTNKVLTFSSKQAEAKLWIKANLADDTNYKFSFDVSGDGSVIGVFMHSNSNLLVTDLFDSGYVLNEEVGTTVVHKDVIITAEQIAAAKANFATPFWFTFQLNTAGHNIYIDNLFITPTEETPAPEPTPDPDPTPDPTEPGMPIYAFEDFESYEVGTTFDVTGNTPIADFLALYDMASATVVIGENGSKCLEVSGKSDGSLMTFRVVGDVRDTTVAGDEYYAFDGYPVKSKGNWYGDIYEFFSGASQKAPFTPQDTTKKWSLEDGKWKHLIGEGGTKPADSYKNPWFGARNINGPVTHQLDNIIYYKLLEGAKTDGITITFLNSTGAPEVTMPSAITANFLDTINLADFAVSSETMRFVGWSKTDGGAALTSVTTPALEDTTYYAVWEEYSTGPAFTYTYANDKKGVADGTIELSINKATAGRTHVELYYTDKDNARLEGYTNIAKLALVNGKATYTFEGSRAIPKGAAKVAARFYASGKTDIIEYFEIPAEKQTDVSAQPSYVFYAISDIHLQDYWQEMLVNRNRVYADIKENMPDFVVINGDLVNHGYTEQFERLTSDLDTHFNSLGIPAFITNGNHEFYVRDTNSLEYDREGLLAAFATQIEALEGMGYTIKRDGDMLWYSSTHGSIKLIMMSTPEAAQAGVLASTTVGAEQLAFLDAELADAEANGLSAFVFSHNPLAGSFGDPITNSAAVKEILNKYNGTVFVSGHTHSNLAEPGTYLLAPTETDKFTQFNDGCAVWQQNPGSYEKGYGTGVVVEIYEDKMVFKSRKFGETAEFIAHAEYVVATEAVPVAPRFDLAGGYSIRTFDPTGLRMRARISNLAKANANLSEYGFLVALEKNLGTSKLSFDLAPTTPEGLLNFTYKAAYDRDGGVDIVYEKADSYDVVTLVTTGIPEGGWNEPIAMRPYAKYDGANGDIIVYGNTRVMSLAQAAYEIAGSESFDTAYDADEKEFIQKIADAYILPPEPVFTIINGDAEDSTQKSAFFSDNATISIIEDAEKGNVWEIKPRAAQEWTYFRQNTEFIPGETYKVNFDVKCTGFLNSDETISTGLYCNLIYDGENHLDHSTRSWTIKTGEGWKSYEFTFTIPESSTDRTTDQFTFYTNPQSGKAVGYLIDNLVAVKVE